MALLGDLDTILPAILGVSFLKQLNVTKKPGRFAYKTFISAQVQINVKRSDGG